MDIGVAHQRTIWTIGVVKIDAHTFNIRELDRPSGKAAIVHGLETAAQMIGNFALTSAFMVEQIPDLLDLLAKQGRRIGIGPGWIASARETASIDLKPWGIMLDESGILSPSELEQRAALRRIQAVDRAFIEATISRRFIQDAIDNLEDDIENRWSMELATRIEGALQVFESMLKIGKA